jgi:predicted amidohydrolase
MTSPIVAKRSPVLRVATLQLTSVDDLQLSLDEIIELLATIAPGSCDLACLPENALYMRVQEGEKIPSFKSLDDEVFKSLAKWCRSRDCALHIGSVALQVGASVVNASVLVSPDGTVTSPYQKIHLFDVDVIGQKPIRESDAFAHGSSASVFSVLGWKIGSSICYDVRFAELYLKYAQAEVDVILIPSAFLVTTGRAHWEVLLRARAIESQAYVVAAAQGGIHKSVKNVAVSRGTYGHSMIVDPWGEVIQTCEDGPGHSKVLRADLRLERIDQVRAQIPMRSHRRLK